MVAADDIDLERFCFYPFIQLLMQPTGDISPCCWNQKITLGTMPRDSLEKIWNGRALRDLRREFLYQNPASCRTQMNEIGCHRWSRRLDQWPLERIELSEIQSQGPRRLDLRLNGKCNLQCVMCDVWKQPNGIYDSSDLWKIGPEEIFPFLLEVDLLGGEPFVQADTYRLIDKVIPHNPTCTWGFVTNGQYRFEGAVRSYLNRIPLRWVQVSLDSIRPETYSKIRQNGELERALKTLHSFRELRIKRWLAGQGLFRLSLGMCIQKLNWREIGEFLVFAKINHLEVDLQFAYDPASVSLLTSTLEERAEIVKFLLELAAKHGRKQLNSILLPLETSLSEKR